MAANRPPESPTAEHLDGPGCAQAAGPILGLRHAAEMAAALEPWDRDFCDDLAALCGDLRRTASELRRTRPGTAEAVERIERELADHGWTGHTDIRDAVVAASEDIRQVAGSLEVRKTSTRRAQPMSP